MVRSWQAIYDLDDPAAAAFASAAEEAEFHSQGKQLAVLLKVPYRRF